MHNVCASLGEERRQEKKTLQLACLSTAFVFPTPIHPPSAEPCAMRFLSTLGVATFVCVIVLFKGFGTKVV